MTFALCIIVQRKMFTNIRTSAQLHHTAAITIIGDQSINNRKNYLLCMNNDIDHGIVFTAFTYLNIACFNYIYMIFAIHCNLTELICKLFSKSNTEY